MKRLFRWDQIRGDYNLQFALIVVLTFCVIALAAPVIAHENSSLIPFGPETAQPATKIYQPPGFIEKLTNQSSTHLLGTDELGRDVTSRLIHGTRTTLLVGIVSTLISFIIALLLGSISGYFGNNSVKLNIYLLGFLALFLLVSIPFLIYNFFDTAHQVQYSRVLPILSFIGIAVGLFYFLHTKWKGFELALPLDNIIIKLLELFRAIPALFLLLAIFSIIHQSSLWKVIVVIGLLRWGGLTRLLRAEVQRLKSESFVSSAKVTGLSDWRIITRHILPNALGPLIVASCFMIGNAILIEASLSFLGIGVPTDSVSWGAMLGASKIYINAWWLAIFPGFLIFLLILSFNILGDRLRKHLYKGDSES